MVPLQSDQERLLDVLKAYSFTRLLVYDNTPDTVLGFINIYEVLSSDQPVRTLENVIKPIRHLPTHTPIMDALEIMRQERLKIALVVLKF